MKAARWLALTSTFFIVPACHGLDTQFMQQVQAAPESSTYAWYSEAELDQLLAPVALYPDAVLSNVLIATTYPLEIVEADRWLRNNPGLDANTAVRAAAGQPWDDSVKALVAFPQLLSRLSDDLQWTQQLGDAFLVAEADVMDRIQNLRQDARRAGQLRSTEQVQVIVERETVIIEPVVERIVHLPYYDTRVVYGDWRWRNHPPVYWRPLYPATRTVYSSAIYWGPPVRVSPIYVSAPYWPQRQVVVVNQVNFGSSALFYSSRNIVRHPSATRWAHKPTHRRGVAYHPRYQPRHVATAPPRQRAAAQPRRHATRNTQMPRYARDLAPAPRQQRSYRSAQQRSAAPSRARQAAPPAQRPGTVTRSARSAIEQYQREERIGVNRSNSNAVRNERRAQNPGSSQQNSRYAPPQSRAQGVVQGGQRAESRQRNENHQRAENRQRNENRQRAENRQRNENRQRAENRQRNQNRRDAQSGQRERQQAPAPRQQGETTRRTGAQQQTGGGRMPRYAPQGRNNDQRSDGQRGDQSRRKQR